uniref:Uncharacterized protein n=1 Tax=Romanomermis culicivorax TaxID=13658 RepID=A0A915K823_ROMCU
MEKPGQSLKAARNSCQPKPRRTLNRHCHGLSLDGHQQPMDASNTSNLAAKSTTNTTMVNPDVLIALASNLATPAATTPTPAATLAVPTVPAVIQPPPAFRGTEESLYSIDFAAALAETSTAAKQQI